LFQRVRDIINGLHGPLNTGEELFARLIEDQAFAYAIKEAAAEFGFEGFKSVAQCGASDMHFGRGLAQAFEASDGAK
jgi:hypothetical protein